MAQNIWCLDHKINEWKWTFNIANLRLLAYLTVPKTLWYFPYISSKYWSQPSMRLHNIDISYQPNRCMVVCLIQCTINLHILCHYSFALGVVAEWSKVLSEVPWPLMVWSTLALGTYQLRFVSWVFHVIFSYYIFHFTLHFGWPACL